MERKHYRGGKEPQGRDRHLEVNGLVGTSFTNVEDTLVGMAKCVELYIMNECDCDKLETREYDEDAKKLNAMKAFWLYAKMPHGIFILRTMDNE